MAQKRSISDSWSDYRPSKAVWFWSMAGAAVATVIVGFTAGGWTTGGSAELMSQRAASDARAKLASAICVEKFATSASAAANLAALKEKSSYQRDNFIEDGGWVTLTGVDETVPGAADLCAEQLAALDTLPADAAAADADLTDS